MFILALSAADVTGAAAVDGALLVVVEEVVSLDLLDDQDELMVEVLGALVFAGVVVLDVVVAVGAGSVWTVTDVFFFHVFGPGSLLPVSDILPKLDSFLAAGSSLAFFQLGVALGATSSLAFGAGFSSTGFFQLGVDFFQDGVLSSSSAFLEAVVDIDDAEPEVEVDDVVPPAVEEEDP